MDDRPSSSVSLTWQNGFRFDSRDSHGHTITLGRSAVGGTTRSKVSCLGTCSSPRWPGCSGIDVVNILGRQRQQVKGLEISVKRTSESRSPVGMGGRLHSLHTSEGVDLNPRLVERAIDLSENRYCSIGATIGGVTRVSSTFEIVES